MVYVPLIQLSVDISEIDTAYMEIPLTELLIILKYHLL